MTYQFNPSDASYYFQANSTSILTDSDSAIVYGNFFHALKNSTVISSQLKISPVIVTEKIAPPDNHPSK